MPSPRIAGYAIVNTLGHGAHSVVYRAERDGRLFAIKVLAGAADDLPSRLKRLRREAAMLARFDHPGLLDVVEVGTDGDQAFLVTELLPGASLAERLGTPLAEPRVIDLGVQLAESLHALHRAGVVHRDVKPQNVIVDEGWRLKLIDLDLAIDAARQEGAAARVAGTFAYSAPEQGGMLKRPVDARADLYSVGVVLFQAATGQLPFQASDPAELVRLHTLRQAPDARQLAPSLSPALAGIIGKLLAKDPDDRYANAPALAQDLRRIAELNAAFTQSGTLPLSADRWQPGSAVPLVGRRAELTRLREAFTSTRNRVGSVALLEGESGSGKSRLLQALAEEARQGGALVLWGKCSQDDPVPFAPLRFAVETFLRDLSSRGRAEADLHRARWREAAGEDAAVLKRFSPTLQSLLAEAPEPQSLQLSVEALPNALVHLLGELAQRYGGALWVLDDVQWLDPASLRVLRSLCTPLASLPLLVGATSRNGPESIAALHEFCEATAERLKVRIALRPLSSDSLAELVEHHLGTRLRLDPAIVEPIAARSGGNPFAAAEYVRAMLEASLLWPAHGRWRLDATGLEHLQLPTDVLGLVLKRVAGLDANTRAVLRTAAVLGSRFQPDVLATTEGDADRVLRGLETASGAHLVERAVSGEYTFVHDRVREALLGELSGPELARTHQRIAHALDPLPRTDAEHLFALARHYTQGDGTTPERARTACQRAGLVALEEYANEEALGFLTQAAARAAEAGEALDSTFYRALGEACARLGQLEKAITHFEQAIPLAASPVERAAIRERLVRVHMSVFAGHHAWEEAKKGFAELGVHHPGSFLGMVGGFARWLLFMVGSFLGWRPRKAPPEQRERLKVLVDLYDAAGPVGFIKSDGLLMVSIAASIVPQVHRLGPSPQLVNVYRSISVFMSILDQPRLARRYAQLAIRVAEQLGDRSVLARAHLYLAMVPLMMGRYTEALPALARAAECWGRWYTTDDWAMTVGCEAAQLALHGQARETLYWVGRLMAVRRQMAVDKEVDFVHLAYAPPALALLGRTAECIDVTARARAKCLPDRYSRTDFFMCQVLSLLERGELGAPMEEAFAAFHGARIGAPDRVYCVKRYFYAYQAYVRLLQYAKAGPAERSLKRVALRRALRELKTATHYDVHRAFLRLVQGALAFVEGHEGRALARLAQAQRLGVETDNPWLLCEVHRWRARLYLRRGEEKPALLEARAALGIAAERGWAPRQRQLWDEFNLDPATSGSSREGQDSTPNSPWKTSSGSGAALQHRLTDALLQLSLALSSVFDPDRQVRVCLDEIVRLLGAERAFLFLCDAQGRLAFRLGRDAEGSELLEVRNHSSTVVERVFTTRTPLVVSGTEEGALLGSESVVAHELRSIIAAPLVFRDRVLGLIYLDSRVARGLFTSEDVQVLLAMANHVAIAMETGRSARLEAQVEAERQERRLAESLHALGRGLTALVEPPELLAQLVKMLPGVLACDLAVGLLREEEGWRVVAHGPGSEADGREAPRAADFESLIEAALRTGDALLAQASEDTAASRALATAGMCSGIAAPLATREGVGAMLLAARGPGAAFAERERQIARVVASQAAAGLENARLFQKVRRLASLDGLTGVPNRRHFFDAGELELARAQRYGRPVTALMIDVDHFKQINDRHGHAAGDQVLKAIADALRRQLRAHDVFGRYGGEEFAALLPETEAAAAVQVAERLRQALGKVSVDLDGNPLCATVSIGVAAAVPEEKGLSALLARADEALYVSKAQGRDRVTLFTPRA